MTTRRTVLKQGALGAATLATTMMPWKKLRAQPKSVKIAVIAPLSGPWARQGTLVKWGAETAVNEINAAGGIKAMGGAKLELVADRRRRLGREGQERRAAPRRAGA